MRAVGKAHVGFIMRTIDAFVSRTSSREYLAPRHECRMHTVDSAVVEDSPGAAPGELAEATEWPEAVRAIDLPRPWSTTTLAVPAAKLPFLLGI